MKKSREKIVKRLFFALILYSVHESRDSHDALKQLIPDETHHCRNFINRMLFKDIRHLLVHILF